MLPMYLPFLSLENFCFQWMKTNWKTDPCYAAYGVDGTPCSFRKYLSEVSESESEILFNIICVITISIK